MSRYHDSSTLSAVVECISKAETELRLAVTYTKSIDDSAMRERARDELLTCELEIESIIRNAFAPS